MTQWRQRFIDAQQERNQALIAGSRYMRDQVCSAALPLRIDPAEAALPEETRHALEALQIEAAATALSSLASLAKIGELDHLGGALDLIPALSMTMAMVDLEKSDYTIENAHTSIGYFACLAAFGFIDGPYVVEGFRRGLDIPGHVSWLPGGTQLNGGRLGVMIPCAVGQALGKKAIYGDGAWVAIHMGDAGWISGQALNGMNGAAVHGAPCTFIMHRNGIQLSGSTKAIMDKDPRPVIRSLGIEVLEIKSLHNADELFAAMREGHALARKGRPNLIYPAGERGVSLAEFAARLGIEIETAEFAARHGVDMGVQIWVPGALMSYRDVVPMLECLFLVNELPGGAGHHDGHMKGRDLAAVLANPMMQASDAQRSALAALRAKPPRQVVTMARPHPGAPNLVLSREALAEAKLPDAGTSTSPRGGGEAGYAAVAKAFPKRMFIVGCDLDPSTKLGKASAILGKGRVFEMSIEEQASALMADGLSVATRDPQLVVFSTFAAFFEGIAREGFELWRYQRNLTGANEGLNVTFHLSHVGACTGRDHFSGWSLDWINLALGYLPYLHRFYAPADARAAFVAVRDLAAHYGAHIIGIPRDNLPVLASQDGSGPLWNADSPFEAVTHWRRYPDAKRAILALGAPAFVAGEAAEALNAAGLPTDVLIVNALPLPEGFWAKIAARYPRGIVTIEDGLIATPETGLRGFAGLASSALGGAAPAEHIGIVDPRVAPSDGHMEVWEHFGLTAAACVEAAKSLG